jgi:hypothetical protein
MVRTQLLGQHTHETSDGQRVHVWLRDDKHLARGRYEGKAFGVTLGGDRRQAVVALHRLLVEIEDGTFCRPSERVRRPLKSGPPPRNTVRDFCNAFLAEKRHLRGKRTSLDYRSRLVPLIEFAEQPAIRKRRPLAMDVDRHFAVDFRASLHKRTVTPNGRPGAREKTMSPGHVFNVLDCCRTAFEWGKRLEVNQLSASFANPFTEEIVGFRPRKDPLRPWPLPMDRRIALVGQMDRWQLCQFAIGLVLALRPDEYTGLLVSEVDFSQRTLHFGTRLSGWDFNKGRRSFQVPFPDVLEPLLRQCVAGRGDGPLLRKRTVVEGRRL